MSVTIDGTGTVTGLSTGGLPDGSIAAADLASNAVDETKLKDALVADFTEVVVTASDSILLGDATDSGNTKRDTVQGILDLAVHTGNVAFPATQVASADANTLDDYEEGSWTPVIGGATSESGQTYAVQSGTYLKIGNTVIVYAKIMATTIGTISGSVRVKGLPFTVSSDASVNGSGSVPDWFNLNATKVFVGCSPIAGTTQLGMRSLASAGVSSTSMASSDVINSTEIKVNAIYHI